MTYDDELTLIRAYYATNGVGQRTKTGETRNRILCCVKSVKRSEFYLSGEHGYKPEYVFVVHKFEYDGQAEVIYKNDYYKVIRTFVVNSEEIELTVERREK